MIGSFPKVFDSSLLASLKSCPQKFKKESIDHWRAKSGPNVHLHAGGSFAKGLEVARRAFYEGEIESWIPPYKAERDGNEVLVPGKWSTRYGQSVSAEEAQAHGLAALMAFYGNFQCPPDSAKSLERTAGALEFYFSRYPLSHAAAYPVLLANQKRAIEVNFAHPLPIEHPETGEPIIYCGRTDTIVAYAGGMYIEDDKTTSSLGPTWSRQWQLRGQFIGYTWGFRESYGLPISGCLIRGVSILKTKYDTQEAIVNFDDHQVSLWYSELLEWITDAIQFWKNKRFRYNLDHSCADYGGCGFLGVCTKQDERPWLERDFEPRHWDPITRIETKL